VDYTVGLVKSQRLRTPGFVLARAGVALWPQAKKARLSTASDLSQALDYADAPE
jgi:hypothetical protein